MQPTEWIEDKHARTQSFYSRNENVFVSIKEINSLLRESKGKNVRLCLHADADDKFHQMLIIEYKGASFPAHRHPKKSEGYHVVAGVMRLSLFDLAGKVEREVVLSVDNPIARIGPATYHDVQAMTQYVVYLESKPGPFVRATDKVMAPWLKS